MRGGQDVAWESHGKIDVSSRFPLIPDLLPCSAYTSNFNQPQPYPDIPLGVDWEGSRNILLGRTHTNPEITLVFASDEQLKPLPSSLK